MALDFLMWLYMKLFKRLSVVLLVVRWGGSFIRNVMVSRIRVSRGRGGCRLFVVLNDDDIYFIDGYMKKD